MRASSRGDLLAWVALAWLAGFPAAADSGPSILSYQGRLTHNVASAPAVDATLPMEFRIFGSAVGTDLLWSESWPGVSVENGTFSVLLGSSNPLPAAVFVEGGAYLEVAIDGETLAPRERLASVAFAHVAETVDGLEGADLEESAEIETRIAQHAVDPAAHPDLSAAIADHDHPSALTPAEAEALIQTALQDALALSVSVLEFGAKCDGTTDDTAAVQAALQELFPWGGEVRFPPGICLILGQIVLPNDGAAQNPRQPPIRFVGAGGQFDGRGGIFPPQGGSVLDLRFGAGPKIATYGLGLFEATGLTFADYGFDSAPFLYTTNTTLYIHGSGFWGTQIAFLANNDAIILGGTSAGNEGTNHPNAPFQGYGTVIRDNFFQKIRRAAYGRVYANSIVFTENTIWKSCGTNLAGGAAIELHGDPDDSTPQVNVGWWVAGNLIEVGNYDYGIKATESQRNTFIGNSFYDPSAKTVAYYRFEPTSGLNYVVAGYHDDSKPFVSDAATGTMRSTVFNFHQAQESVLSQKVRFVDSVTLDPSQTDPYGPRLRNAAGAELTYRFTGGNGLVLQYTPGGGAPATLLSIQEDGLTLPSGCRILSGSGPPAIAAPDGSTYQRTDGGAGSTFYVRENGAWVPK